MVDHDTSRTESSAGEGASVSDRLIDAALGLAGESGWRRLTMAAVAERAGVPLNEALQVHGSRNEVLRAMGHHVDQAMLREALGFTEQDSPRDRLFDMLMRRYDTLSRWRPGLAAIIRDLPTDPVSFVVSMQGVYHSMGLALEAAGLAADGVKGIASRKGLAAVYLSTMRVWVKDDSEDNAQTMAALDKGLDRAESVVDMLCRCKPGCDRRRRSGHEDVSPVEPITETEGGKPDTGTAPA